MLPAAKLLHWNRFDIYTKWAYASYAVAHGHHRDPTCARAAAEAPFAVAAYSEHERTFNGFWEGPTKAGPRAYVEAFHATLRSIQDQGFSTNLRHAVLVCPGKLADPSAPPMPTDGAHRIASALSLGVAEIPIAIQPAAYCAKHRATQISRGIDLERKLWEHSFFESRGCPPLLSRIRSHAPEPTSS